MSRGLEVSIQAPVNIALVKYWGKRNEELILPLNDSISVSIDELFARTRISIGPHIGKDEIVVNGQLLDRRHTTRFNRVFQEVKRMDSRKRNARSEFVHDSWHIKVESETNFPTSAGLASSAAGFAAIGFGLGQLFHLGQQQIVRLARLGSGSACRSILDGFVHWKAGTGEEDDADCTCETIAPAAHWPQLRAVILVVSEEEKKVGSSEAMRNTVRSSKLLDKRVRKLVPGRVESLREAILARDFAELAQITMAESDGLHALCENTDPPVQYLNATSLALIEFVLAFNRAFGTRLAYTFDAGPNCCLFLEQNTLPLLRSAFGQCFSLANCAFPEVAEDGANPPPTSDRMATSDFPWPVPRQIQLERIVVSKVGTAPRVLTGCTFERENGEEEEEKGQGKKKPETSTISVDCKML